MTPKEILEKLLTEVMRQERRWLCRDVYDKEIAAALASLKKVVEGKRKPLKSLLEYGCDVHACGMDDGYNKAIDEISALFDSEVK